MHKLTTVSVLALTLGTFSLRAQLVEAPRSVQRKTAPKSATPAPRGETRKTLDKKLSDFGFTPRSLATWRTTGGRPSLTFFEIQFRKIERPAPGSWERPVEAKALVADGMTLNGFQVQGADFLEGSNEYRSLALLRLNRNAPQASKDGGHTWIDGEKTGEAWVFAFDNETLTIQNADETFAPTEFKAWALERAAVTRTTKRYEEKLIPYFHSAIVAVAYGKNEIQGLVKFPGTDFVMSFRGIRHKDRWVGRATQMQPFNTYLSNHQSGSYVYVGARPLKTDDRQFPQFELDTNRLQIGTGSFINYAQEGDSAEQLRTAMEFDLRKGVLIPQLAEAYRGNLGRSLWLKSDEEGSFSRDAEKAYVKTGLPVWFYPIHRTNNPAGGYGREAEACLKPMVGRLKALDAKVEFIKL